MGARIGIVVVAALVVAAGWLLWSRSSAPPGAPRLFVSNYRADTVSAIDLALGREIASLAVGHAPMGLALRPGGVPQLAVANSTASHVTLIDPVALTITGTLPAGKGPEYVAFSPDGARLYSTSPYDMGLTVVDVATGALDGVPVVFDRKPGGLAVSPDGTRIYVLLRDVEGAVAAVDAATREVVGTVPVGKSPTGMAVSPDGTRVMAASFDDNTISVIDTATLDVVATWEAPTGMGLLAHPRLPLVYSLASFDDQLVAVDYTDGRLAAEIDCGQWPTYGAISPDGATLYVPNEESDNIAVIDTATGTVTYRIAVGDEPAHAALFIP